MSILDSIIRKNPATVEYPLVPIRELVIFPHTVVPFFVGKKSSIAALEAAMAKDRKAFVSCLKQDARDASEDRVYAEGTVVSVVQMLRLPDGTARVLAEGLSRGRIKRIAAKREFRTVEVAPFSTAVPTGNRVPALTRAILTSFETYSNLLKKIPPEVQATIDKAEGPDKMADLICHHMNVKLEKKQ
jgi:ATP-dependent Lon protease